MDVFTSDKRSEIMRHVQSKNTTIEKIVRSTLHQLGYRFRLHRQDLPGCPDIVFPSRHKVIFVHGCFWHGHECLRGQRVPKTNVQYWKEKILRNQTRDGNNIASLTMKCWDVLVVWECQIKDMEMLKANLKSFLN